MSKRRPAPPTERLGRWVSTASWIYAAAVLAAWGAIRWCSERWWPATVLLYGPRWAFLGPLPLLAIATIWTRTRARRRRLWLLQGATALFVTGPLMAVSLPVASLVRPVPEGPRVRLLSFNQGEAGMDVDALIGLIERERIEIVCLQEVPESGELDPALDAYFARGWRRIAKGSIVSRLPIVEDLGEADFPDGLGEYGLWHVRHARARIRLGNGAEIMVSNVHMPTMRRGFEGLFRGDPDAIRRHSDWRRLQLRNLLETLDGGPRLPALLAGDLNTPGDGPMLGPLRGRFQFGFERSGWGYGYTRPSRFPWVRIDHILAGPEWAFARCWIGPNVGSDHLPIMAEVVLPRTTLTNSD